MTKQRFQEHTHSPSRSSLMGTPTNRRAILGAGLAVGGAVLAGRGALANQTPEAPAGLTTGVDYFPSPAPGVPEAFERITEPQPTYDGVPGNGGTVRIVTVLWGPPLPGRDENTYWRELERRLGVTWSPVFMPVAQYGDLTATSLAGGDLPELFYVNTSIEAPHLTQAIQQGAFADLTDYLSGDAIQAYPNLASIDPAVFRNISINGRIYGVPKLIPRFDNTPFHRADWADTLGLNNPENADDFYALMDGITNGDPNGSGSADTWGLGSAFGAWHLGVMNRMFRVPNEWRLEQDGSLVNAIETDRFRQAVEFCRRMNEEGLYHPAAATMTYEERESAWLGGQISIGQEGYASYFGAGGFRGRIKRFNPEADLRGIIMPGHDGGEPVTYNGSGEYGFVAITAPSARDEERVQELLRILDYLLAPFASEEQIFLEFGIEGVHHTVDDDTGVRSLTEQGEREVGQLNYFPLVWANRPEPQAFFYPDVPGEGQYAQELALETLQYGIDNPVMGLFSPTGAQVGAQLQQLGLDRINSIITGRDDISALDDYIAAWRSRGGDEIRAEYEDLLGS